MQRIVTVYACIMPMCPTPIIGPQSASRLHTSGTAESFSVSLRNANIQMSFVGFILGAALSLGGMLARSTTAAPTIASSNLCTKDCFGHVRRKYLL